MDLDRLVAFTETSLHDFTARHRVRHVSYGILDHGELVHEGAVDTEGDGLGPSGTTRDVFRIASMTKSFTAATLLDLADRGIVALDQPVVGVVDEIASWRAASSRRITFRDLLTMGGGLPTDNPWGDRQQDLEPDEFLEFLRVGPAITWEPDSRFEYSNLGYAILGLAIERLTDRPFADVIGDLLLRPLEMHDTTFDAQSAPERQVPGIHPRGDGWLPEPTVGHGAFSPMGGLFSTVVDIARWVRVLMCTDPDDDSVLGPDVRRSMQRIHRVAPPSESVDIVTGPTIASSGYGYGLSIRHDVQVGALIGHSGGYPGFGSNMCWHPASGIGMVVFANTTYVPVWELATTVVREGARHSTSRPSAEDRADTDEPAARALDTLVTLADHRGEDRFAALFAESADRDRPLADRAREFHDVCDRHGPLVLDAASIRADRPNERVWWMSGIDADVRFEISLAPDSAARLQALTVTAVAHPPEQIVALAERLVSTDAVAGWPDAVPLVTDDPARRRRAELSIALLHERFGPCTLGRATERTGDSVTFGVTSRRSAQQLAIRLTTDASGALSDIRVTATAPPTRD